MKMVEAEGQAYALYTDIKDVETGLLDSVDPGTGAEGYEAWDLAAGRPVFVSEADVGRLWDYP